MSLSDTFHSLFSIISSSNDVSNIIPRPERVVTFEKIDGPIIHMKFNGAFTDISFENFVKEYETYFQTDYKFVLLFDLRNVYSDGFKMEWIFNFVSKLQELRELTATHVLGTAVFLSKDKEDIVNLLKVFFKLYKTVRPHFASTNEDELMNFIESVLFV